MLALRQLTRLPCGPATLCLPSRAASNFTMTSTQTTTTKKEFWEKNKELARPMSPFMYQLSGFQITSTLSITHRITGVGVGVVLYGAGLTSLISSSLTFPELISIIQANVPLWLILTTKTAAAGGLLYHTFNGIRHLFWDAGFGFKLKHLYLSGYVVVALTAAGTVLVFLRG